MPWLKENPKGNPVHYPPDRRFRIYFEPKVLAIFLILFLLPIAAAWLQYLLWGLPEISPVIETNAPAGFPAWIRFAHYANLLFMTLLIRSGLSILMDHPRLYWSVHCTPGTEWARFTPLKVPAHRLWTAKDDSRYISSWLALPGYRHTVGVARHWHFPFVLFFLSNGIVFAILTLITFHWRKLVPLSWQAFPNAWAYLVHYLTFHMPSEPNGYYSYQSLQQISYSAVIFIMAPLSLLTGLAMSPAIDNHFPWYTRIFGNRQIARSLHFILLLGYIAFIAVHVLMVILTGFARNMNHIVIGTDDTSYNGIILGLVGVGAIAGICVLAHWLSWSRPRALQYASKHVVEPLMRLYFNPLIPVAEYTERDISPYFWPNGKMPTSSLWKELESRHFRDYRLRIFGLVQNPVELSLEEIKRLGKTEQITLHHCIQGWSGIAKWGGLPMSRVVELVKPHPEALTVIFSSFGEGLFGGKYYDSHLMTSILHPQTLLAYEMNDKPLEPVYGAPLRLRVENQLGYKMVKWIESIEFVSAESTVGRGFGGKNEDDEYFDLIPNI